MVTWILIVLLFIGTLVSYVAGVRKSAGWGTPVLVICVLALIAVVIYNRAAPRAGVTGPTTPETELEALTSREFNVAKLLGQGLKAVVSPGSRVFILSYFNPEGGRNFNETQQAWKEGLSAGLGDTTWTLVGHYGPIRFGAQYLSEGLGGLAGQIDAVVCFGGLPDDLPDLAIYAWPQRPKVACFFPAAAPAESMRRWLQDGLVDVAVMEEAGQLKLYTPTQLP